MEKQKYPFVNPPLLYGYSGLEPYIDARTMMLHHDRHLQTYIDNLNKYLETKPEMQHMTLEELIVRYPHDENIRHNAGGVWNHEFFFSTLRPGMSQIVIGLSSKLMSAIAQSFGNLDNFKEQFTQAATSVFGSGYAWLCASNDPMPRTPMGHNYSRHDRLHIITTPNQDTPLTQGLKPLLCIDVWEHAYYLKHYNVRQDYIRDFWNVVDWVKVSSRLD